jgi:SH3-like domain-containing protein
MGLGRFCSVVFAACVPCFSAITTLALAKDSAPTTSGLPVPRYVSLKSDHVNVRAGPTKDNDVAWVYTRSGLPVEITAEFENWRRVRDSEGAEGWVYHSLLSGRRTAVITMKSKDDLASLYERADSTSAVTACRRASWPRSGSAPPAGVTSPVMASTAGSSSSGCGAFMLTKR